MWLFRGAFDKKIGKALSAFANLRTIKYNTEH